MSKPATRPKKAGPKAAKNATTRTAASVDAFVASLPDEAVRADAAALRVLFERAVGAPAKMWGKAIVGFGERRLVYESGRELDWIVAGFSPRKGKLTLYLGLGDGTYDADVAKLGRCTTGKGCLYLRSLSDVGAPALAALVRKVARAR